ncbi:MAG: EpsD family peptidyl-prolyl cis-trans isomerase [Candidatus Nitricoxidivorans perseverans]|uniref:peptidylprolyl isomerase n=1 Tax=Candidatus Nitricoxidivorans perseverans TaxID=2975601 RepID=A0AA49FLU7_9PROT|nr:MAG: EpsD family peptidyl-prolyl cis-trans isomerase [Candidatus Nitricoxidivorans perseverans]
MPLPVSQRLAVLAVLALAGPLLLSGCGKKDGGDKPASQVLAKVNGDDISVHQLNHVLARQPGLANAPEEARRQVLEKLVERQLIYQQAVKEELDRTPDVMLAMDEARRDIVAGAYLRKIGGGQPAPGEKEAARYYDEHPVLFAQRKIYRLREIALPAGAPQAAEVKAAVAQGQSFEAIVAHLKSREARFESNAAVRAAEQLPLDALALLAGAAEGRLVVFETPRALVVYQVLESQSKPVDQAAAMPSIKGFLANQQAAKAVAAEVKRLRETARVEYPGEADKAVSSGLK